MPGKAFGLLIKRVAAENDARSPVMLNNFVEEKKDGYSPGNESPGVVPPLIGLDLKSARDDSRPSSRISSSRSIRVQSPRDTPRKNNLNRKLDRTQLQLNSGKDLSSNRVQTPTTYSDYTDSEDDNDENENRESQNALSMFWNGFSDSIKKINDSSDSLLRPRPNFKSSEDYKEVMTDMFGNTEYNCTRGYTKLKDKIKMLSSVTSTASKLFARAAMEETDDADDEVDVVNEETEKKKKISEIMGAKRGWKLLKRHVNENIMEEHTKESKMNWSFLQHHVHNMSNAERARVDLYERYGLVPIMTDKGKMECKNKMFDEQLRAEALTNLKRENNLLSRPRQTEKKRATSAKPSYNSNWGKKGQKKNSKLTPNFQNVQRPVSSLNVQRPVSSLNIQRPVSTKRPISETFLKPRLSR